MRDLLILICWRESLPANVIKIKPEMVSYFPSPTPSAFSSEISLHKRLIKEWPDDDKRAVEVANSALPWLVSCLIPGTGRIRESKWHLEEEWAETCKEIQILLGRGKNWNRWVSPHVVHCMLAEMSEWNKIYKIHKFLLAVFQVPLWF